MVLHQQLPIMYEEQGIRNRKPTGLLQINMVVFPEVADVVGIKASVSIQLVYSQIKKNGALTKTCLSAQ